jgi:hypothetical protein
MDTVPEILGNLVMLVAFGYAVVGADILGIQPPYDHLFVFPDGKNRPALPHGRTGGQRQQE